MGSGFRRNDEGAGAASTRPTAKPSPSARTVPAATVRPALAGATNGATEGVIMRDVFQPCVYILASRRHGTLYVGVTSNLLVRIVQHREGLIPGFTKAYGVRMLVWYEMHDTMEAAIVREKRLKDWRRAWKIALIEAQNEDWADLGVGLGLPRLASAAVKESDT
jgi:putative endonuclease